MTYVWASGKGEDMFDGSHMHSVLFETRYLQRLPSDTYYLLYFSFAKNCVVGYSDGFRVSFRRGQKYGAYCTVGKMVSEAQRIVGDMGNENCCFVRNRNLRRGALWMIWNLNCSGLYGVHASLWE